MTKVQNYIPMFAYGILKYPRNIIAEGGRNIIEGAQAKGMRLYSMGGKGIALATKCYPKGDSFEVAGDDDKVVGTYFEVPEDIVTMEYDYVEGFDPNGPKHRNMYNRQIVIVTLPNGEEKPANMYVANYAWFYKDLIPKYYIESGVSEDKYLLALRLDANKGK